MSSVVLWHGAHLVGFSVPLRRLHQGLGNLCGQHLAEIAGQRHREVAIATVQLQQVVTFTAVLILSLAAAAASLCNQHTMPMSSESAEVQSQHIASDPYLQPLV